MFCIYSFDFIKKNTEPQLSKFTPSKFLSNFGGTFKFFFNLKSFFTNKQYEVILTPPLKSSILSLILVVRLKDIYRGSELETGTHAAHHPLSIPVVTVW